MFCFETDFVINSHDCGPSGVLKPSGYLHYMQEAANMQVSRADFSYDRCLERGTAFLLSRVALDVFTPLRAEDKVLCRTYPADSRALSFNRSTALIKDGKTAALLSSVWALVNIANRSLVRVEDSGLSLPTDRMLETRAPLMLRLQRNADYEECRPFYVGYSFCDRNRHLNNTRYPDVFCDAAGDLSDKTLTALSISYLAEAPMGETLRVFRAPGQTPADVTGETTVFRAVRESDGKLCCEALMTFSPCT